jgi:hypothetical protein
MVSQPSCWRLSPRISSSRLATSSPRPGWANNSLVTTVLISACLPYWGLSVAGGVFRMMMRVTILPSRTVK